MLWAFFITNSLCNVTTPRFGVCNVTKLNSRDFVILRIAEVL